MNLKKKGCGTPQAELYKLDKPNDYIFILSTLNNQYLSERNEITQNNTLINRQTDKQFILLQVLTETLNTVALSLWNGIITRNDCNDIVKLRLIFVIFGHTMTTT